MRTANTNGMLRIGDNRDVKVFEFEVEREGVMKFKPIYEALHAYLIERGWSHPQSGDEKIEDLYWERWMPQGHKEQHIWWRAKKDINKYIRYFIALNYQTLLVSPADVQHKGKKMKKVEFHDTIIRVQMWLQFDINDLFKNSFAWKFKKVFFSKIYSDEIDEHTSELHEKGLSLQRTIKHLLEMQADKEASRLFEPPMGYKEP